MSESKYVSVIHVPTDKIVTAFKFENDATWIGRDKDELIATANYCEPGQKIKMIFVKSYTKSNGKFVYAYFRAAPGEPKTKTNLSGEGNDHKKAKENIYELIYSNKIKINNEIINKNLIEDIFIEYRNSISGGIIPDIIIKFKKEHIKYGLGIFFEIQFSKQSNEETIKRTYQRVIEGYSGVWLFKDDFDDNLNLINKNLVIKSQRDLLLDLEQELENNFIKKINEYGNIIDKKLIKFKEEIWNYFNSSYKSFQIETKEYIENGVNKLQIENQKLKELKKLANELDDIFYKTNVKNLTENINKAVNDGLIFLEQSIKNKSNEIIKNNLDQTINKINKMCPICNKPMRIGKCMGGYNWYCYDFPRCDSIIKEVDFNEG